MVARTRHGDKARYRQLHGGGGVLGAPRLENKTVFDYSVDMAFPLDR